MKFAEYMAEQRRLSEERRDHARLARQARQNGTPPPRPLPPERPPEPEADWSVPRRSGPFKGVRLMVVPEPRDAEFVARARREIAAADEAALMIVRGEG